MIKKSTMLGIVILGLTSLTGCGGGGGDENSTVNKRNENVADAGAVYIY